MGVWIRPRSPSPPSSDRGRRGDSGLRHRREAGALRHGGQLTSNGVRTGRVLKVPFTASHIAAVLPIARSPLVSSALVIGSMSPDFPYYLPVPVSSEVTHSLDGAVSVDVLLGLVVFMAWHGLLTRPALAASPAGLRGRIPAHAVRGLRIRLSTPRRLQRVLLSLFMGAATHVGWDSFTHAGGWGPTHVPWLAQQHGPLTGYGWAQYGSGVFGALFVARWLVLWWDSTPATHPASGLRPEFAALAWTWVFAAAVAGAASGSLGPLTSPEGPDFGTAAFLAATRGIAWAGLVALLLAACWRLVTQTQIGRRENCRWS